MGLTRYLDLVRAPGAARVMAAAAVGRLPYGMIVLALILLLRAEGFSYAETGLVTGASGMAVGATAPVLGRVVDSIGQTRVMLVTAALCIAADVALVAAALSGAGVVALIALALVAGASTPPLSPCMRALWPRLVGPERLDTAFAFDALQLEVSFIAGPLLAAALAASLSPQAAFLTAGLLQAGGALAFASAPASRAWKPESTAGRRRRGALGAPGMVWLLVALASAALGLGILEIGIPAFAEQEGTRADSGWLFALWGVGSLVGGLWYGARRWSGTAWRRFLIVFAGLALAQVPLPLAGSLPVFAGLVLVAGLGLAPSTAAGYSLIGELAPREAVTEAYAWQIVAYVVGGAVGAWLAGGLVDELSVRAALACAPLTVGLGFLVALAGRRRASAGGPAEA
jgi:MFS family permease